MQGLPVTSDCDADIMAQCMKTQGLDTFAVGQVKACLVNLGVPQDPSVLLAAEVRSTNTPPLPFWPLHIDATMDTAYTCCIVASIRMLMGMP